MKRVLFGMVAMMMAMPVFADDGDKRTTSQPYVYNQIETTQVKIPAANPSNTNIGNTVITYTNVAGGGTIGERGLFTGGEYNASNDADKLITASALNNTFTNLPTTDTTKLECANQSAGCTLWTIVDQTAYGETITLPAGYTRLAYIQSTGTQLINTGYVAQETDSIEVDYTITDLSRTGDKFIIGAQPIADNPNVGLWIETYDDSNTWYVRYGSPQSVHINSSASQLSGTFIVSKNSFVVNGTKILEPSFNNMSPNPMTIFSRYSANGTIPATGASVQISAVRVKNGNSIVHKYISARRNSDNVLGMYDTVNGQFYTNQGSGTFTAGPEIN